MMKKMLPILLVAALCPFAAKAGDKPALVVHAFTLATGTTWPYDMKQMPNGGGGRTAS